MVVVLVGDEIHLTVVLQTARCVENGIDTVAEVGIEIEPFPHDHRAQVMVFDGLQKRVARLSVQTVLINDITAQLPVRRAPGALGIAEG